MKLEQMTLNKWLFVIDEVAGCVEAGETVPDDLAAELDRVLDQMRAMKARSDSAVKAARTRKPRR